MENLVITEGLLERLHITIQAVGEKRLSVDEGYGEVIKAIFGINNYLSITFRDKLTYLAWVAEATSANNTGYLEEPDIAYFCQALAQGHFSDN